MTDSLQPALAFFAGALTILSPCVLPLVPIVLSSAAQRHKWGSVALAAGLVSSFTVVGFLLATVGVASGFDGESVRQFGAVLLMLAGIFLVVPQLQAALAKVATPLANWANQKQSGLERFGLIGQAAIGALLGLVWSPCVGPTLGAATVLAAQGQNLVQVALVMLSFGLGIASILLILAFATRGFITRWRAKMMQTGNRGKYVLGGILLVVGMLIITGGDHLIEGLLVSISPEWLTELTTRF